MTTQRPADTSQGRDAYLRLIEEIRQGTLRPGDRLTEADLASRLGISRTPGRDALRRLEADGLVVHTPRVGATVRRLDYTEVTELYDMRAVLEATAARMAAQTASRIELTELGTINAEMRGAQTDPASLAALNRQFHRILLNAARNRFLAAAVNGLEKTLLCLGPSTMEEAGRASAAIDEHETILAALAAHDGEAAAALMQAHIRAAHRMRLQQFRALTGGRD